MNVEKPITAETIFLVIRTLIEKALVKPYWLVTTRITPSFPVKKNPFKAMMKSQPRITY